jgi:hypothetical protein
MCIAKIFEREKEETEQEGKRKEKKNDTWL